MPNIWDIIIGIVFGILTNFFVWYLLFHWLSPKISFDAFIEKRPRRPSADDRSSLGYWIRFRNVRKRLIVDLEISAAFITDYPPEYLPGIVSLITIPLDEYDKSITKIRFLMKNHPRMLRLLVNSTEEFRIKNIFPQKIKRNSKNKVLNLEELFSLGPESKIRIVITGFDSFSGSKKIFIKEYHMHDIKPRDDFHALEASLKKITNELFY